MITFVDGKASLVIKRVATNSYSIEYTSASGMCWVHDDVDFRWALLAYKSWQEYPSMGYDRIDYFEY